VSSKFNLVQVVSQPNQKIPVAFLAQVELSQNPVPLRASGWKIKRKLFR
jgi:hypothetical protein